MLQADPNHCGICILVSYTSPFLGERAKTTLWYTQISPRQDFYDPNSNCLLKIRFLYDIMIKTDIELSIWYYILFAITTYVLRNAPIIWIKIRRIKLWENLESFLYPSY